MYKQAADLTPSTAAFASQEVKNGAEMSCFFFFSMQQIEAAS